MTTRPGPPRGRASTWLMLAATLAGATLLAVGISAGWLSETYLYRPLPVAWEQVKRRWAEQHQWLFAPLTPVVDAYVARFDPTLPWFEPAPPALDEWLRHGANPELPHERPRYRDDGSPAPRTEGADVREADAPLRRVRVTSSAGLVEALRTARAGDDIVLAPGRYNVRRRAITLVASGDPRHPIVLRAERLGDARIAFDALEGFHVRGAFWVFENLDITGVCERDAYCEHAFHVVGAARSTIIRNTRMRDFNAPVKVNGTPSTGGRQYPDDGLIERCTIYNTRPRRSDKPVSLVDIVAANRWRVTANTIADFAKASGNRVSYGAFIKGNAHGGIIDRNLVLCAAGVPPDRGTSRIGLSLGGGGTDTRSCRDGDCRFESRGAVIRNNVVMHCSDVGIYLNRAHDAAVLANTLYGTWGIHARFPQTSAFVAGNVLAGRIADRDGASTLRVRNLRVDPGVVFRDPGNGDFALRTDAALLGVGTGNDVVSDDFCGRRRPAVAPDAGAFQYDAGDTACRLFRGPSMR